jgi:hypothetical protein
MVAVAGIAAGLLLHRAPEVRGNHPLCGLKDLR